MVYFSYYLHEISYILADHGVDDAIDVGRNMISCGGDQTGTGRIASLTLANRNTLALLLPVYQVLKQTRRRVNIQPDKGYR